MSRQISAKRYAVRFQTLIRNPSFWILTAIGNSIIFVGGVFLFLIEASQKGGELDHLDCILWSAGTVTTIGYGSYTPETSGGKIMLLVLMLIGTLFVWSYMAFVVTGLIAPELSSLEKDVHDIEKELQALKTDSKA